MPPEPEDGPIGHHGVVMASAPAWQTFPHGADIGVRGTGSTREEAFAQAARALCSVVTEPDGVRPETEVDIDAEAPDDELLLLEWLNHLVYEMDVRGMLFSRFEVRIDDGRLTGRAWGEPVDTARHEPAVEVKGATVTELRVERGDDGTWRAQCVVDV
jgi:tRNA nucleotidyltransferase (CCA-adding enzyme)